MKLISKLLMMLVLAFFMIQCAGSADQIDDESAYTDEEQQQKELDDIEALLGISPSEQENTEEQQQAAEEPAAQNTAPADDSEKLDLLDTNESIPADQGMAAMSSSEKKKLEKEIQKLKKQLKQKDKTISNLSAELSVKEDQLSKKSSSFTSSSVGAVGDVSMEEYQQRYDEARQAFESRNYQQAIQLFESLLAASSTHPLADNAQYWIGESQFMLRQYDAAILSFEKVFTFSNSNKNADAQYKLGLCYMLKGDKTKARDEFNRLIEEYPKSNYVGAAKRKLARL